MAKLRSLIVPDSLQRNAPEVLAHGVETTGESLLRTLAQRIGRADLTGLDLLGHRLRRALYPDPDYTGGHVRDYSCRRCL